MFLGEDDYRAEALVAIWLENSILTLEELTITPVGLFQRPYSKDVLELAQTVPGKEEGLTLHLSREGLYDMLPEGLFHQPHQKVQKSTAESVAESERYKKEEKAARAMFLPLEQEFYRQRIWLEHIELRTWLNSVRPESESLFLDFWEIDNRGFSARQVTTLLAILPHLHELVGDLELTAYCLQKMVQEPVTIGYVPQRVQLTEVPGIPLLGNFALGVDMVLGNNWWSDEPALEVSIGPLPGEKLSLFMPEGKHYRQLEKLYKYFFPAEVNVVTSVAIHEAETDFRLLADSMHAGRLGYTTEI